MKYTLINYEIQNLLDAQRAEITNTGKVPTYALLHPTFKKDIEPHMPQYSEISASLNGTILVESHRAVSENQIIFLHDS